MPIERTASPIRFLRRLMLSAWLWGGVATVGFYLLLPYIPVGRDLLTRYCSSHPLEYVLSALFFVGLAILGTKTVQFLLERRVFRSHGQLGPKSDQPTFESSLRYLRGVSSGLPESHQETYWGRRLDHLQAILGNKSTGEGLGAHLTYLAEADADRLHHSHSLLQTVIWSIPILGFLGTVMGITLAIANVTPEQLESSLDDVTGGLAVAFDTTALALTYSIVLGFASLFVKRAEERLLAEMDEHSRLEVQRCFPTPETNALPLLEPEAEAFEKLVSRTTNMNDRQMDLWSSSVETIRDKWGETIDHQRRSLAESLSDSTKQAVEEHRAQIEAGRQQILNDQQQLGTQLISDMERMLESRQETERDLIAVLQQVGRSFEQAVQDQVTAQQTVGDRLVEGLTTQMGAWQSRVDEWQSRLGELQDAMASQGEMLLKLSEQFEQINAQSQSLAQIEERLASNLETVRTAEAFDETLHNLSAAVHLLTSRVRTRDAA